jgi:hypothetical protein
MGSLVLISLLMVLGQTAEAPASLPVVTSARRSFQVPRAVSEVQVPDSLQAVGMPVHLRAVKSSEKLGVLVDYFRREFEKADLFVPEAEEVSSFGLPHLTAFDPEARISYSVFFQLNRDETVTVILGEAHLAERRADTAADFAPLFPGASSVLRSNVEAARSVSYDAPASPDEVVAFYRETLGSAGYEQVEPGVFFKHGSRLQLTVRRERSRTRVFLFQQLGVSDDRLDSTEAVEVAQ